MLCQALPQRAASLWVQNQWRQISEPAASDQSVLLNCSPQASEMARETEALKAKTDSSDKCLGPTWWEKEPTPQNCPPFDLCMTPWQV